MSVKELRNLTGMSQSKFAKYFDIPVRTIQKWECGQAEPRPYILSMMRKILALDEAYRGKVGR